MADTTTTSRTGELARFAETAVDLLAFVEAVAEDGTPILGTHAPDVCENPY